jgi:hypothetical protein
VTHGNRSVAERRTARQRAASRQSEQVATAIIKDKLEKDEEFIAFIEGVYRDGVKMFTGMDREKLVTKVADKLSEALVGERRY